MKTIYVVEGSTGEWSDRTNWIVCAYESEDKAKEHVEKASEAARVLFIEYEKRHDINQPSQWDSTWEPVSEWDPHIQMDYTGTFYTYTPCKLNE